MTDPGEEPTKPKGRKKTTPKATASDADKGAQVAKRRAPQAYYDGCDEVAKGGYLAPWLRANGMSRTEFHRWLQRDDELKERFARARATGYETIAEELLAIADAPLPEGPDATAEIQRRRLASDNRKWLLERWSPAYRANPGAVGGASVSVTIATGVPEGGTASRRITVEATDAATSQRLELYGEGDAEG
jgi:hypothetical protein